MTFLSKVGNILRRTTSKHLNQKIFASRPSILQAIRCMSSSKVFVGGLSYNTDETSLGEAFGNYGQVVEARVIVDRETGRSRGFGFVTFTNSLEASSAIQALDGQDLHGRRVNVNYAHDRAGGRGFGGDGNYGGNYGGDDGYGVSGNYRSGGGYNSGNHGAGGNYGGTDDFGAGENYGSAGSSPGDGGNQGGGSSYGFGGNQGGGGSYGTGGNFGGDGSLGASGNLGVGIDSYGSASGGNYNSNFGGGSYGSGFVAGGHDTSSAGNFNSTGNFGSHGSENHQNYGVAGGVGGSDNFASDVSGGFGNNTGLGYIGGDQFGSSNMGNVSGSYDQNEPVEGTIDDDSGVVAGGHDTSSAGNFNSTGDFGSHDSENHQNYAVAGGVGGSDNFASDVSGGFGNNTGLGYTGGDQFGSSNMGNVSGSYDQNEPVEGIMDADDRDGYANRNA